MNLYLADVIPADVYGKWFIGDKVIIAAPTGSGKTMFILIRLLPYAQSLGKKVLILCNRRLLREQYFYDLIEKYTRFCEMQNIVSVWTYQHIAEELKRGSNLQQLLSEFDVVVCDEIHYIYADSDFNCWGTYVLFQAVIRACFEKTIIMFTATLEETLPLVEKTYQRCEEMLKRESLYLPFEKYSYKGKKYDYSQWADYGRFNCIYVEDKESLCEEIANTDGKTIMFIDDVQIADSFRKSLIDTKKVSAGEVVILNSRALEENLEPDVIRTLTMAHKVPGRVLITTSVLDNGVSIQDEEVKNVIIATESRVSFLQMLGRIRAESSECCNLYLFPREVSYYEKRVKQYEERINMFDTISKKLKQSDGFSVLLEGWCGKDENAEQLRNILALTTWQNEYYSDLSKEVVLRRGDSALVINEFAKEKVGNMLMAEKLFLKLSVIDSKEVAIKQIGWIGKSAEELIVKKSTYKEEKKKLLRKMLLEITDFTNQELQVKKEALAKLFKKDLLGNDIAKDGSFATDKLKRICARHGLVFEQYIGDDKKQRYSVKEEAESNVDEHKRSAD